MLRDHAVVHREQQLDETRGPGSCRQVADVRLHRTHEERAVRLAAPAVDRGGGVHLGRIADLRPRPVRLEVVHLGRRDPGPRQRFLDDPPLGEPLRGGESRALPVLVHRRSADDAPDPVPGRLRLAQALQDQHPAALAPHESVRAFVEGPALPGRRQHPCVRERFGRERGEDHAHPAREREVRLAPFEARHRMVDGYQGRGAGGVDGDRRPLEAQCERDPAARGAEAVAGDEIEGGVRPGRLAVPADDLLVLVAPDPGVDAAPGADQPVGTHPRVLERFPAQLQEQPLLRVERFGLERRDPEELGVELVNPGQECAEPGSVVHGHGVRKHLAHAPFAVAGRAMGHRVPARGQQPPEGREVVRAGEPARHAHDRNRFAGRGRASTDRRIGLRPRSGRAGRMVRAAWQYLPESCDYGGFCLAFELISTVLHSGSGTRGRGTAAPRRAVGIMGSPTGGSPIIRSRAPGIDGRFLPRTSNRSRR